MCENINWIQLAQNQGQQWPLASMAINLQWHHTR